MADIMTIIEEYGGYIIFAIIILFTGLTMWYYSKKDIYDPEPPGRLMFGFFLGILSVIPAFILSILGAIIVNFQPALLTIVVAPIVEEIAKLWFVIYLAKSDNFDGPLDGLIYGAMVGAGFAAAENVLYGFAAVTSTGVISGVTLTAFRSLTQLIGHPLYTGLAGVGVGEWKVGMAQGKYGKLWRSILFHGLWNLSASIGDFTAMIMGLIVVVIFNIYMLRKELKRTLELDKDAYERGYYDQKQKMLEEKRQRIKQQISQGGWKSPQQKQWTPNAGPPSRDMSSIPGMPSSTSSTPSGWDNTSSKPTQSSEGPNFCKYCGNKREYGDIFCRNCGSKMVDRQ